MRKRVNVARLISIVLSLDIWVFVIFKQPFLALNLFRINIEAHNVCQNLINNPLVGGERVEFYLIYNPLFWLINRGLDTGFSLGKRIYFGPLAPRRVFFEVVAAHEIGHVVLDSEDQHKANLFALRILGGSKRNLFVKTMRWAGYSDKEIRKVLEEFDAKHSASIEKAGFGISIVPLGLSNPHFLEICRKIEAENYGSNRMAMEFVLNPDLKEMAFS